jgi:hypothetical protein
LVFSSNTSDMHGMNIKPYDLSIQN